LLLLRKKQGEKVSLPEKTFLNKSVFLFLAVSLISVIFSRNKFHSQEIFFQRYLLYFILFFIAAFLSKKSKNFRILLFFLVLGACIVSAGSVWDILKTKDFNRLFSSFGEMCLFGNYFLYILPFFICVCLFHKNIRLRVISFLAMLPFLTAFLYHYSRGMWIALILSFVIVTFIFTRYKKKALITVAFFLLLFLAFPQFKTRLFSMMVLDPVRWGDRMPLWEAAMNIFKSHPFIGSGIGTYELFIYKSVDPQRLQEGLYLHHLHASNTYLEILAEMGVAGLIAFLFIFYNFLKYYFKKLREGFDIYRIAFAIAILAVLIAELTTSTLLIGFYPAASFWCFLGMAVGRESGMESEA
jgi:O-antigen ligase